MEDRPIIDFLFIQLVCWTLFFRSMNEESRHNAVYGEFVTVGSSVATEKNVKTYINY